jgi:hypothetical protein
MVAPHGNQPEEQVARQHPGPNLTLAIVVSIMTMFVRIVGVAPLL